MLSSIPETRACDCLKEHNCLADDDELCRCLGIDLHAQLKPCRQRLRLEADLAGFGFVKDHLLVAEILEAAGDLCHWSQV